MLRNLGQKSAYGIILHFPPHHTGPCTGESEVLHGPGDTHIGQAPLLFDRFACVVLEGLVAGKNVVLHAGDIHVGKLKSLGAVQCHEQDAVIPLLDTVDVRDQGDILEKAGKSGFSILFFHSLLVIRQLADQFFYVVLTVIGILFARGPESIDITRCFENMPGQINKSVG